MRCANVSGYSPFQSQFSVQQSSRLTSSLRPHAGLPCDQWVMGYRTCSNSIVLTSFQDLASAGDHIWIDSSASGDFCYVGESDCLVRKPAPPPSANSRPFHLSTTSYRKMVLVTSARPARSSSMPTADLFYRTRYVTSLPLTSQCLWFLLFWAPLFFQLSFLTFPNYLLRSCFFYVLKQSKHSFFLIKSSIFLENILGFKAEDLVQEYSEIRSVANSLRRNI